MYLLIDASYITGLFQTKTYTYRPNDEYKTVTISQLHEEA